MKKLHPCMFIAFKILWNTTLCLFSMPHNCLIITLNQKHMNTPSVLTERWKCIWDRASVAAQEGQHCLALRGKWGPLLSYKELAFCRSANLSNFHYRILKCAQDRGSCCLVVYFGPALLFLWERTENHQNKHAKEIMLFCHSDSFSNHNCLHVKLKGIILDI